MNTRLILITTAGAFLWLPAAQAGNRDGPGTGTAAITIPADTISSGGGRSSAGTGTANAIVINASIGGVIGTVTAATPAVSSKQGFIPQILPSFDHWAAANIPAGRDRTFTGDWNGDGILNGVAYVFGNTRIEPVGGQPAGAGKIPAPPAIPADVNVYLEWSERSLSDWVQIVRWENGNAPVFRFPAATSITGGYVIDTSNAVPFFYRYRVVRR